MGCAQAKPSMNLSSPQGLQRLKMENGYTKGKHVEARRSTAQRHSSNDSSNIPRPEPKRDGTSGRSGGSNGGTGQDGKLSSRGSRKDSRGSSSSSGGGGGGDVGNISKRITSWNMSGEDELVNGWPKWLTDNIPKEVLAGLVPKSADSYDKIDKIGEGTYSNVYKARDRDTGKIVALKKVRFDTSEPESIKFMAREIMMLQKLDHPNIIKLEGLATSRMQYSLYLVFDYMQSDLASIISRTDERLTEPQVKCYMKQLLSGLAHCHERGILHRDIKGSNLLIDKKGVLKIADLGLANHFDPNKKRRLTSRVVTLWYRAPELLLGSTDYGPGIDLWSAGCLVAEMFIGRPIMPGRTEVEQLHRIFKLCGSPPEEYWKKLKVSSTFRPPHSYKSSLRDLFRDFPPSALRLLNVLLALDSRFRGSAASALQHEFFHTNPLPCDLSGLPVIYKEEDEALLTIERRRSRNPKMRRRSKTQRERHKTDLPAEKPTGDSVASKEEPEKMSELDLLLLDTSTLARLKQEQKEDTTPPPFPSPEEISRPKLYSEAYPSATKNIANLPPLPNGKPRTFKSRNDDDEKYSSSRLQRSASTIEYRNMDQKKLSKLHAVDDF